MNKRQRSLLDKVGKYYLQYKGIINLTRLLEIYDNNEPVKVNDETLKYIKLYITYILINEALELAEEAKKDKLIYREFTSSYDNEEIGVIDIDRSLYAMPSGLMAYYTYREGINAPEYSILGYLLRRLFESSSEIYTLYGSEIIKEEKKIILKEFKFLKKLEENLKKLDDIKEEFPEGFYRMPLSTDPSWLKKAFDLYDEINLIKTNLEIGIKTKKRITTKKSLTFIFWKLYELYSFYLIAQYFNEQGYSIRRCEDNEDYYIADNGVKKIKLIFNKSLNRSILNKVNSINDLNKFKGKPDISLIKQNNYENSIIFECKFSSNPSYITLGRYKIMAYAYEYDPLTAVLIYPGLNDNNLNIYDPEDSSTIELDKELKKKKFVDFVFRDKTLYIAIIDPLLDDDKNIEILKNILVGF